MATRKTTKTATSKTTAATRMLRNQCYDILVANLNRNSKWYQQDCDDIWNGLLTKSDAELRTTLQRQRAINNVTEAGIRRHCQFEGMF